MQDIKIEKLTMRAPPTAAYEVRIGAKPTRAIVTTLMKALKAKLPKGGIVVWMPPRRDNRLKVLVDKRLPAQKVAATIASVMVMKHQTRGTRVAAWREFR